MNSSERFAEDFKNKFFQEQDRSRTLQNQVTELKNEVSRLENSKKFFEQSHNDQRMNSSHQETRISQLIAERD